ncbi:MAG: hypothetical protein NC388_08205 [Clostridium sp.]|nr:hypothetical protein [Clostridium sp.]
MRKAIAYISACSLLLMSCSSSRQIQGLSVGTTVGAVLGSSLGGILGGYRGHDMGTLVGTVAGGLVGVAATAPRNKKQTQVADGENAVSDSRSRKARKASVWSSVHSSQVQDCEKGEKTITSSVVSGDCPLVLRNLRFIDDGRNQVLNRKESSKLIFELINPTHRAIAGVVPYVAEANGNNQIIISPSVRIESIAPGDGIRYTVEVKGGTRLKAGTARFRIDVSCDDGPFVTLREFTLPTAK